MQAAIEDALGRWARNTGALAGQRDPLVREAGRRGIAKTRIHELTGLSRVTIDRILRGDQ